MTIHPQSFAWSVAETNAPPRELAVEDIQTELQLLPYDLWQLDNFQARFAGARFRQVRFLRLDSIFRSSGAPPWSTVRADRRSR